MVRLHQVGPGETLKSIARDQLGSEERWREIAYKNSISHPYFVAPGELLQMPAPDDEPIQVTVVKGTAAAQPAASSSGIPWTLAAVALLLAYALTR